MLKITEILLESTTKSDVAFNLHLGGNTYVSVTSGVLCVDIRQWYVRGPAKRPPTRPYRYRSENIGMGENGGTDSRNEHSIG